MKNDDLISRRTAIDALWEALYEYEDKTKKQFQESDELDVEDWILHRVFVQNMSDIDRQTIMELPSAQPERKKGRWIRMYANRPKQYTRICSECGEISWFCGIGDYNYCPWCGAIMKG